jgi:hypothetical protein
MSLTIRLGDTAENATSESEFSVMMRRTFLECVKLFGTTVTIANTDYDCLASPVELAFSREVVGKIEENKIRSITMLAEDFDQNVIVLDQTTCVIDGLTMIINVVDRDPADPCIRFSATSDISH